jgi:hypothetical protein
MELISSSRQFLLPPAGEKSAVLGFITHIDGALPNGNLDHYKSVVAVTAWEPATPWVISPVTSATKHWKDTD